MCGALTTWRGMRRRAAALALLVLAGWGGSFLGRPAARWQAEKQPALQAGSLEGVVGQGVLLGMFGGFRAILADFAWVRSYVYWEQRDRAGCESLMRMTLALDPGNDYFWLNTGDVIAFNMAHWEVEARRHGGRLELDPAVAAQIKRDYAERGLAVLEQGAARFPRRQAQFWLRCAHVCLMRLNDTARGADYYRRAAECDNPAWFAGLAYANILSSELGRKAEALRWLRDYRDRLGRSGAPDPQDIRGLIEETLRRLETGAQK